MKCSLCVGLFFVTLAFGLPDEKGYNKKYDNFDIDLVLGNTRILKRYIQCFMDKGSCTAEAQDVKRILAEVIATNCSKCNEHQKDKMKKITRHMKEKNNADWQKILTKYDPTGTHKQSFETFIST